MNPTANSAITRPTSRYAAGAPAPFPSATASGSAPPMPVSGACADRTKKRMATTPIAPRRSWWLPPRSWTGSGGLFVAWDMVTPEDGGGFGAGAAEEVLRPDGRTGAAEVGPAKLVSWTVVTADTEGAASPRTGQ